MPGAQTAAPPGRLLEAVTAPTDPGADSAEAPDEVLPGRLWIAGSPIDWTWVHEQGISVVSDVADPGPEPSDSELDGVDYRKQTLVDGAELPDAETLREVVERTVTALQEGRRALVACSFGRNRSGLVVALVLRKLLGCSGPEALDLLRQRRRRAVNNPTFSAYVSGLGRPDGA